MADYIKTFTGKKIDPLNPKVEDIELRDIAHALSLICRGNGQVTHFYSVAQHCINAVYEARERGYSKRIQLICLFHDAAEAYVSDVVRPVKKHLTAFDGIEEGFLNQILNKFGLTNITDEEWEKVQLVDDDILTYDLVVLLKEPLPKEGYKTKRVPDLSFVDPTIIEEQYMNLAKKLLGSLN